MQDIEFEVDENHNRLAVLNRQSTASKQGPLVKLVMKLGVKDSRTANFVLLGVAIASFGVAIYLYLGVFGITNNKLPAAGEAILPGTLMAPVVI